MSETTTIYICATIFLLLANSYFAAIEYALLRCELFQPKRADEEHDKELAKIQSELADYLSIAGICRGLILLLFGYVSLSWLVPLVCIPLGIEHNIALSAVCTLLAASVTLFFQFIASDVIAKSISIDLSNRGLNRLLKILRVIKFFIAPLSFLLNSSSGIARRIFGIKEWQEFHKALATSELVLLASRGTDQQPLDVEEKEMLQGVFSLSETVVREVMTPRTDVVALQEEVSLKEVAETIENSSFSRFPVYGKNRDDIKGMLLAKDLMPLLVGDSSDWHIRKFIRQPYFVPETKTIDDLLEELKAEKFHMALVVDEHGGFSGLVTMEDLLEEIVGEIFDESDEAQDEITEHKPGHYEIDGGVLVDDINTYVEPKLPIGEYDTIAGFVFTHLGKIPETGAKVIVSPNYPIKDFLNGDADNFQAEDLFDSGVADLFVETEASDEDKAIVITVTVINGHRIEQLELKEVSIEKLLT